jgi:transposase
MDESVNNGSLFDLADGDAGVAATASGRSPRPVRGGRKRMRRVVRNQILVQMASLDDMLPRDHQARVVWEFVCGLDLSELLDRIAAVERGKGRAATDPRILMALWLYATLDGVGSTHEVARLCEAHVAYRWICGGVTTNHHTLSDFRTAHVELLDRLLTDSVAAADACSASRPGARRETLDRYIKRMEELESIATSFNGVEQAFAIQAGRELRVLTRARETTDETAAKICHDIARAFEERLTYPGEIKVTVLRESRFTDVAR